MALPSIVYALTEAVMLWFSFPIYMSLLADQAIRGISPRYHPPEEKLKGMYAATLPLTDGSEDARDLTESI